jgi:hypothetical protein
MYLALVKRSEQVMKRGRWSSMLNKCIVVGLSSKLFHDRDYLYTPKPFTQRYLTNTAFSYLSTVPTRVAIIRYPDTKSIHKCTSPITSSPHTTIYLHSKLPLHVPLQTATNPALAKAIAKADSDRRKQPNAQQCRPPLVVIHDGSTFTNLAHAPQVQQRAVHERDARDDSERPSSRERQGVAEVEERGGNAADEDAEFEPGEEGALGGELDFGFDADGDVDACSELDFVHMYVR